MTRGSMLLLSLAIGVPVVSWAAGQQTPGTSSSVTPQIQNGRVEVRRGTSIDRDIAAVSPAASTDPVWLAWRVPMVNGDRDMCSWYGDRSGTTRGILIDESGDTSRPQITQPKGPVPLEAGTGVITLLRLVGGKVERIRTVGDDCPMDAGGRVAYWLDSVTPAESLRFLNALAEAGPTDRTLYENDRRNAEAAVRAIGYHKDPGADAILDRIATAHRDSNVRQQAASTLASLRGAHGVATITTLIAQTKEPDRRRSLATALGQSRDAAAVDALRRLIGDEDARVRAEAAYYFVLRGGTAVVPDALKMTASDKDENVRRRTVSAIGRLPSDAGVPQLLQLARTTSDPILRKEAVSSLSQSRDPRAVAYMEELLKR